MNLEQLTLDIAQSTEIKADIGDVFKRTLHRLGEGNAAPDGTSLNMILEEWAGGRWFRDRGEGLAGQAQAFQTAVLGAGGVGQGVEQERNIYPKFYI